MIYEALRSRVTHGSVEVKVVILAGGKGARLAPYTSVLPKPLMPIGGRSIIELVIDGLATCGFKDVTLCVGHLSHLIEAVLTTPSNGPRDDVKITCIRESTPLGTAAPLRHVEGLDGTFLVMNGDVLTTLDYRKLLEHHHQAGNVLTIAAKARKTKLNYGVLHLEKSRPDLCRLSGYEEKPELISLISMGIYVLEPEVLQRIPDGQPYDFPDLVSVLLEQNAPVGVYPYDGFWLDIGHHEDYAEALRIVEEAGGEIPLDPGSELTSEPQTYSATSVEWSN